MRIQSGKLRGREVKRPKTRMVRPMSGLLLGSLFDILGPLDGLTVLDAYAGSGLIGFEALSRGAAMVTAIEMLPLAIASIKQTRQELNLQLEHQLFSGSVENWLASQSEAFDLIIAGPPFAKIQTDVISCLGERLKSGGTLVLWHTSRMASPALESLQLVRSRSHGDSTLSFYKQ